MQVVTPTPFPELWADPRYVDAVCPELVYHGDIPVWNEQTPYALNDYVWWPGPVGDDYSAALVYRAMADMPAQQPAPGEMGGRWVSSTNEEQVKVDQAKMWLAISEASWVLWSLTNGKFHGTQCWAEDYRLSGCTLRLRRGPVEYVHSVETVHDCGKIVEPYTDWCLESVNTISFCCHHPSQSAHLDRFLPSGSNGWSYCGCDQGRVRVTYQIGNNLPPGTSGMVAFLACERAKGAAGKACSLPDRVTTVTRQGVSWTLLDPQDFLSQGMTGVARLDQWLAVAKRGISGEFIDPLAGIRLFSVRGTCGGQFGDQNVADPVAEAFDSAFRVGPPGPARPKNGSVV